MAGDKLLYFTESVSASEVTNDIAGIKLSFTTLFLSTLIVLLHVDASYSQVVRFLFLANHQ